MPAREPSRSRPSGFPRLMWRSRTASTSSRPLRPPPLATCGRRSFSFAVTDAGESAPSATCFPPRKRDVRDPKLEQYNLATGGQVGGRVVWVLLIVGGLGAGGGCGCMGDAAGARRSPGPQEAGDPDVGWEKAGSTGTAGAGAAGARRA